MGVRPGHRTGGEGADDGGSRTPTAASPKSLQNAAQLEDATRTRQGPHISDDGHAHSGRDRHGEVSATRCIFVPESALELQNAGGMRRTPQSRRLFDHPFAALLPACGCCLAAGEPGGVLHCKEGR